MRASSDSVRSIWKAAWSRLFACLLFLLVGLIFIGSGAIARGQGARVVVVVANYLSLEDLHAAGPNMRALVDTGAVGLANTGTRWAASAEVQYLAVGSGFRLYGSDGRMMGYDAGELVGPRTAVDAYALQSGRTAPKDSAVCLNMSRLLRANQKTKSALECVGLLGNAFHKAGLRTAVIGNSDSPPLLKRDAAYIAMDQYGVVDTGAIGSEAVRPDVNVPCGITDNLEKILPLAKRLMLDHGLVVVELGDFGRLEDSRDRMSDVAYEFNRERCLRNLDRVIGAIRSDVQTQGATLIVCSPCRASEIVGFKSNLSPIVMWKAGGTPGLLLTPTTRMGGLLNNTDVAPTILRAANLAVPAFLVARPAEAVSARSPLARLGRMEQIGVRSYALQIPVLVSIAVLMLVSITISEVVIRRNKHRGRAHARLGIILLVLVSMPAVLLCADSTVGLNIWKYVVNLILSVVGMVILTCAIARVIEKLTRGRVYSPLAVLMSITAILIIADALTGTRLLRSSIISCDQITGIRYYGIGNEYMGILIGSSLLGPVLFLRSWAIAVSSRAVMRPVALILTGLWFGFVSWVIGYPGLGANVGGLLMAISTFGTALIILSGARLNIRHGLVMSGAAILTVAAFAVADIFNMGVAGSHLGRAIVLAHSQGWPFLLALIVGKIGMHLGILSTPQAIYPLIFSVPFLVLYCRREKSERLIKGKSDIIRQSLVPAIVIGMAVGFLFNDSGVVPAALLLALYLASVLYLQLEEIEI